MSECSLGFRVVGAANEDRRAINWPVAFSAYAACDERANLSQESFLSAFTFDNTLLQRQDTAYCLDTENYEGICGSPFVWFDIDREGDLDGALCDARRLVESLTSRYSGIADGLLSFFSGSKGFHIGLTTSLWGPEPAVDYHARTKRFAVRLAEAASVKIDLKVYAKVNLFRAPNSRHPKTGLYKRHLSQEALFRLEMPEVLESARAPQPFEIPSALGIDAQAVADWREACEAVRTVAETLVQRRTGGELVRPYVATIEFIREGAPPGERANRLFAAAANLAECGFALSLVEEMLREPALRCGLSPHEVRKTIANGIRRGCRHD